MRRMKEDLVSVALRFQVAVRISEEDEKTVTSLRREAAEARMNELIAKKQATEATEIVQTLRLEISALKRTLKDAQNDNRANHSTNANPSGTSASGGRFDSQPPSELGPSLFAQADEEVEQLLATAPKKLFLPNTGGEPSKLTTFQQWKIHKFVFSANTPAGSMNHDKHAVDMMAEAATRESLSHLSASLLAQQQLALQQSSQQLSAKQLQHDFSVSLTRPIQSRLGKIHPRILTSAAATAAGSASASASSQPTSPRVRLPSMSMSASSSPSASSLSPLRTAKSQQRGRGGGGGGGGGGKGRRTNPYDDDDGAPSPSSARTQSSRGGSVFV